MGKQYTALTDRQQTFIAAQRLFFVATATTDSRLNVSPKGMDCLRVLDSRRVVWLNVTGSGNETSAHVQEDGRMTLMFCAFEGDPLARATFGPDMFDAWLAFKRQEWLSYLNHVSDWEKERYLQFF